jgi:hypothetical protein
VPDETGAGRADEGVTGKADADALKKGAASGNKALGRGLSALARPASAGRESTGTGSSPR